MKILFCPQNGIEGKGYKIGNMIDYLGWGYTYNWQDDWDVAFLWQFAGRHAPNGKLNELKAQGRKTVNCDCFDLSKIFINEIHKEVLGYSTFVDNSNVNCLKKSNQQGQHDGIIVKSTEEKEKGYIYQKLIDTRTPIKHDNTYLLHDIRVPVFKDKIPFLIIKYKIPKFIVADNCVKCEIVNTEDYLTADEIIKVKEFAKQIKLEYGELDILRDNCDGKIYITDAGKTPGNSLFKTIENPEQVIKKYSESLKKMLKS